MILTCNFTLSLNVGQAFAVVKTTVISTLDVQIVEKYKLCHPMSLPCMQEFQKDIRKVELDKLMFW